MLEKRIYEPVLRYSVLVFCLTWLVYMMVHHKTPLDVGDGISHFYISQASWENPNLFLDHWGKPVFILLSSTFTQFGFNGVVIFNILVFVATVLIGYKILRKFNVSVWLQILLPLVLLKAHDIVITVLGGLTEPLFNLAIVGAVYLLVERKFFWFAVLVSFMPFMRSEGQLPMLLALMLLLYYRSYKTIPYLFTGFILYAISGLFVYQDFWWYFTKSPYSMSNDIYGKGTWSHYLLGYKSYLGNPGLYVLIIGIPTLIYLFIKRKWTELVPEWLFFSAGIFFGVLVSHSYFWATGQNGSLGLSRIGTQGMPAFLLLNLQCIGRVTIFRNRIANSVFALFSIALIYSHITTKHFPQKTQPLDAQVVEAANYLKTLDLKGKKVYYHFPLLSFIYGENNCSPKEKTTVHYTCHDLSDELKNFMKPGDLLVRDSHFGPVDMRLPLSEIEKHPELVKIREFICSEQVDDPYGEVEGVTVYQYIPVSQQQKITTKKEPLKAGQVFNISENTEYTDLHTLIPIDHSDSKVTFRLTSGVSDLVLTYDYNKGQDYSNLDLKGGDTISNTYLFRGSGQTKFYIWNPKKVKGNVTILSIEMEEVIYHPFVKDQL